MKTTLHVDNTTHELSLDSRLTLLDALRDVSREFSAPVTGFPRMDETAG